MGRAAVLEVKGDESPNQGRMGGRDIVKGRRAGLQDMLWDLSQSGRVCMLSPVSLLLHFGHPIM